MTGLRATFHDKDLNTDYDKEIEATRERMKSQNPLQSLAEIELLINTLSTMRRTYWSRLPSGMNFGLMTPHKSRIDSRIQAFEGEKKVHELEKDEYLRNEAVNNEKQKFTIQCGFQLKMYEAAVAAAKEARQETIVQGIPTLPPIPATIAAKL